MNLQEEMLKIKNEMIDEFDKRVEALKVDEQEFPQDGDEYCYVDCDGDVLHDEWGGFASEEGMLKIGNVFKTKEQAEFAVEKLRVEAELRKFSRPIFKGCYYIYMMAENGSLALGVNGHYKSQGTIYFESDEKAQQAIKSVGEDRIKKYIFGVEE